MTYPNTWQVPEQDERWEELLRLIDGIQLMHQVVSGSQEGDLSELEPMLYPFMTPTRLVALLREVADGLEELTERDLM